MNFQEVTISVNSSSHEQVQYRFLRISLPACACSMRSHGLGASTGAHLSADELFHYGHTNKQSDWLVQNDGPIHSSFDTECLYVC